MRFTSTLSIPLLLAEIPSICAILVAPQSQCSVKCGNVLQSTDKEDIVCGDYIYDSQPGATMKSCMECELGSGYKKEGGISDMQAVLYNIRYTANHCIFNDTKVGESPCITSFACGHFKDALQWGGLKVPSKEGSGYEYCDGWDEPALFRCQNCLGQIGGQHTLFNYMSALSIACKQRPAISKTLDIEGSLFDGGPIKAADTAAKNAAIASTFHPPQGLSIAAIVGIACAGLVVVLIFVGCFIVCRGRRKRRAYLANYASEKEGHGGVGRGGSYFTRGDMSQVPRWKQKQTQIQRDLKAANVMGHESNGSSDSPQSASSHAGMTKPSNFIWPSPVLGRGEEHSPISAVEPPVKTWSPCPSPDSGHPPQNPTFSPYISHVVSPVSPLDQKPQNGQWGAVPIPRPYRRGSVGSMPGRVGEGEQIEMSPMTSHSQLDVSRSPAPPLNTSQDTERGLERTMNSVNDFGRSPIARSVTGSVRSGRSGRSFRDRVTEDESWRNHARMVGFVPALAPVIRHPSQRERVGGHQRNVSVESIGEAL